ncbi:MAG: hypothetical protein OEY11_14660 [Gammaproteobacteria bacterium]|nr:hypothetical protein [Gammaproteobacteria bacterium]
MMRFFVAAIFLVLVGCIGGPAPFVIKQADGRFSNNKDLIYSSLNNRISTKSVAGGTHIDSSGVFVNPFISTNKAGDKVLMLGFQVVNLADYSTAYGDVNQLGVIRRVIFRVGGELIALDVVDRRNQSSGVVAFNPYSGASMDKSEAGTVLLSKREFLALSSGVAFSCKIIGSKRSVTYEEDDIAESFKQNLKQFAGRFL